MLRRAQQSFPGGALVVLAWLTGVPTRVEASDTQVVVARRMTLGADAGARTLEVEQTRLHGIAVRGASRSVVRDGEGRLLSGGPTPSMDAPQVEPSEAVIDADELPQFVQHGLDLPQLPSFEGPATLVYRLTLGAPVLAWEVQLPLRMRPEPTRKTVWVSAMTGRVLGVAEQVRTAQARVFDENPSTTPEAVVRELPRLGTVAPGAPLEAPSVAAFNCVAEAPDEIPEWIDEGDCYPQHSAFADADGNFFLPVPEVIDEGDNVQAQDAYAELSMYFHGARFLDTLAAKGIPEFACEQATMLANVRTLEPSAEHDFAPLNNAFYTNQCDPTRGTTMMFGQGVDVDFAYDGDVVYHELGHGVVAMLAPEGLGGRRLRVDGTLVDAGAMNEAIADYMTYMMTGDPRVGEYVGRFWTSSSRKEIRTGENQKRCPDNTVGQVHNDGEPFAAALWTVRSQVGEATDQLVLRMLPKLASDASLEDGAAALQATAAQLHAEGLFDDAALEILDRALATRGLLDCPRVIVDNDEVQSGRTMHLRRRNAVVQPFMPGPMQLRYEVPEGVREVEIGMGLRGLESADDTAAVLVRYDDSPISFSYELIAVDDPGDATGETRRIREVTFVRGDWDEELVLTRRVGGDFFVRLALGEGDVVHVALAARAGGDLVATDVAIRPLQTPEGGSSGTGEATGSSGDGPLADDEVSAQVTSSGGCGCRARAGAGGAWGWGLAGLLGLAGMVTRRRRGAHPRVPR